MMRKVLIKQNFSGVKKIVIHAVHPLLDTTLCMDALEGDEFEGDEWSEGKPTKKKINCDKCKRIIHYCRNSDESV